MLRVLVTGYAGYVGAVVVRELASRSCRTVGYDSNWFWGVQNPLEDPPERSLEYSRCVDTRDLQSEDFEGFDAVVHLAAVSNDPIGSEFDEATLAVNVHATRHVAGLAQDAGVSNFIFASSTSVYGAAGDDLVDEASSPNPQTAYASSKLQSENDLMAMASSKFKVTLLRFATAHGYSPRLRTDLVLNDFVINSLTHAKYLSGLMEPLGGQWFTSATWPKPSGGV